MRSTLFWPSMSVMFLAASAMGVYTHQTVIKGDPSAIGPMMLSSSVAFAAAALSIWAFPAWEDAEVRKEHTRAIRVRKL